MANTGTGNRFASVNLNKSYGQSSHPSNHSSSFNYGSGQGRGGGGAGGMLVLSRPRSSQKAGPKLAVPPPLNLPSLRKEHEKFDPLGSGAAGSAGASGGIAGGGARPSSSGLGWSKPSSIVAATGQRDGVSGGDRPLSSDGVQGVISSSTGYMPPSARLGADVSGPVLMEKAAVLRGEDFPSLSATLAAGSGSGPVQKHKDSAHQKHSQGMNERSDFAQREGLHNDMRPHVQSQYSRGHDNNIGPDGNDRNSISSCPIEQGRMQDDLFLGPLPLMRLNRRSDWADDERDTSHGLIDRSRDHLCSKTEAHWDRDFDLPRTNFLLQKPVQSHFDRRAQCDNDVGKVLSNEVSNAVPLNRDARAPSREGRGGQSWRRPSSRDGLAFHEAVSEKSSVGSRPTFVNCETANENKHVLSQHGGSTRDEHIVRGRQQWNNSVDPNNGAVAERNVRDRHGSEFSRYKLDAFQNSTGLRSSFSSGGRGLAGSDHSNFGRDKSSFSRGEKAYMEDPFMSDDFDLGDPFSGAILGVIKRKKDANKVPDIHDPMREYYEAELERVQKMHEQERQRVIEEQERAMEIARREEEERQRLAREQEEHQRRLEEAAHEAAWRAEEERKEAIRRAEEQRLAREQEKRRISMEEERRKQAAKQKLQELEERIARRQAEAAKADGASDVHYDRLSGVVKETDTPRADDFAAWEDGERMVERITNTASSDASVSKPFDTSSRPLTVTEGSFYIGKSINTWRGDGFENGNSSSFFPQNDVDIPTKGYHCGGIAQSQMEDFFHSGADRWGVSGDGGLYGSSTELEADFDGTMGKKFDVDWGQGRERGCSAFSEHLYQNSELEYAYGKQRYPVRQPRVLPPPSFPLVHRTSFRNESEQARSLTRQDRDVQFDHAIGSEAGVASHQNGQEEDSGMLDIQECNAKIQEVNRSTTPGCESQSSLCVSSAPGSPTELSHDDLDDPKDPLAVSGSAEGHDVCNSEKDAVLLEAKAGKRTSGSISVGDDEDWAAENGELQQQEEYDEDVRYNEVVQDGDDDEAELNREFDGMHLGGKGPQHMMDNVVLGFDQGVEVGLPNDECERSPGITESLYVEAKVNVAPKEIDESFDGGRDAEWSQVADVLQHNDSCLTVEEGSKAVQEYPPEPVNVPLASKPSQPLSSESTSVTVFTAQQPVPSSVRASSESSIQSIMPSVGGTGPNELPVKLQFGLFSGPPLIPSPIPSIQIGSIQMPLPFPPQIGPSLSHMHAPQAPLFQFGQLRYPSPISQGFSPLPNQSLSFAQPNLPSHYPPGQYGGPISVQPTQEASTVSSLKNEALPLNMDSSALNVCLDVESKEANLIPRESGNGTSHQSQADISTSLVDQVRPESYQQIGSMGVQGAPASFSHSKPLNNKSSESQAPGAPSSSHFAANLRDSSGPTTQGLSGNKGRRFTMAARSRSARSSSLSNETYRSDVNGFQRRRHGTQRFEFRVRQATDGRQSSALPSSSSGSELKSNYGGNGSGTQQKSGPRKDLSSDNLKLYVNPQILSSGQIISGETGSVINVEKPTRKETSTSEANTALRTEGSLKRNIEPEDDVDAPLQSGIVRVFKQPGIETLSDEDDFIEVRSKRQMLNDRREQREKEIKSKSSSMKKAQRKSRPSSQGNPTARNSGKITAPLSAQAAKTIHRAVLPKQGLVNSEVPAAFNSMVSSALAPIGTPPINADLQHVAKAQTMKQTGSFATTEQTVGSDLTFHSQSNALDVIHSSVGSQGSSKRNPLVMALTQTQLEEAMKPVQLDKVLASAGDHTDPVTETTASSSSSSSLLRKDSPLSSKTSPVSCLLAGEKIQFGAVTSPTILPPSMRVLSHSIRVPASSQSDVNISQSMPPSGNDYALLFEKEKNSSEPSRPLEDCEAEAEAAASAVAVAAINNDEAGRPSGSSRSVSISVSKGLEDAAMNAMAAGMTGEQQAMSHSKGEENLSVSLPADLSVGTPPISLWPPLPSPHSSSSQGPSPFSGGPSSRFPLYDMNPVMGGHVFAFGPREESAGTQPQNNSAPNSGPLGTWQQCHPGVYSIYGPTGFTAPFISPPGNMPEVQGQPHMVVYNHFAPVGQFGQVGLSYMGSTYIPSGKQPGWEHNLTSSAMSEGEMNRLNMQNPVQRGVCNLTGPVQHVTPGSPFLSMASPMAMFEVPPFQSPTDASINPRWSHTQPSSLHSIPQSMPLNQQPEVAVPSQINHGGPGHHHPLSSNGFSKSQTSSSLTDNSSLAMDTKPAETQMSGKPGSLSPESTTLNLGDKNRSVITACGNSVRVDDEASGNKKSSQVAGSGLNKTHSAHQKKSSMGHQFGHYQRGGGGKKNISGVEWSSHKMGFHGRSHSSGGERGFPPTKVRQIYVAKQSTSGATKPAES